MTLDDWTPLVGESFDLEEMPGVALKLSKAREQASERLKAQLRAGERVPFALEFQGPRDPMLPQRLYELTHPKTGKIAVFLVPVDQQEDTTIYEAIFN